MVAGWKSGKGSWGGNGSEHLHFLWVRKVDEGVGNGGWRNGGLEVKGLMVASWRWRWGWQMGPTGRTERLMVIKLCEEHSRLVAAEQQLYNHLYFTSTSSK